MRERGIIKSHRIRNQTQKLKGRRLARKRGRRRKSRRLSIRRSLSNS
jgi:hypothetical protein